MLSRIGLSCGFISLVSAIFSDAAVARQGGGGPPDYGIDFVTIGSPGNTGYTATVPQSPLYGRGAVAQEFRIGRYEITTSQWLEYYNTFSTQEGINFRSQTPAGWGAVLDPNYHGPGERYQISTGVPNAGMLPVYGLPWRSFAYYCNWLHNDRASSLESRLNGAYDTTTFTRNPNGTYNDQRTRNPGARFWIPSLDEWMKAAYYDPNRYGPGVDGWWEYDTTSDTPPTCGVPGVGQSSCGVHLMNFAEYFIPLGAYPQTMSPWGLFDTSGASYEWTEETFEEFGGRRYRVAKGSSIGQGNTTGPDWIGDVRSDPISSLVGGFTGFRIASAVPSPPTVVCWLMGTAYLLKRRSRTCCHAFSRPWPPQHSS